jgi:hypothetical protein
MRFMRKVVIPQILKSRPAMQLPLAAILDLLQDATVAEVVKVCLAA